MLEGRRGFPQRFEPTKRFKPTVFRDSFRATDAGPCSPSGVGQQAHSRSFILTSTSHVRRRAIALPSCPTESTPGDRNDTEGGSPRLRHFNDYLYATIHTHGI